VGPTVGLHVFAPEGIRSPDRPASAAECSGRDVLCLHSHGGTEDKQEDLVRMALLRLIQPLHLTHDSYSGFTVFTPMKAQF
jgi:hypothetical protein